MYDAQSSYHAAPAEAARTSTAALFGQVLFLVAVAIGFAALGTFIGRDLSRGVALGCSLGGFGMLMVAAFGGQRFRVGAFAIGWLYALALLIGLGLGPAIAYVSAVEPAVLTQAAGGTALTVLGMGALGFALSKDLKSWMRPLSLVVFGLIAVSLVMLLFAGAGNPIISLAIYGISALLVMVNFNFLRKHGTDDDTVWLATGIFVSIVNIFVSLLNLFSGR
ncbi:MAG: Bax inhibitor-1 family protein [Thermoleophilaceae bacterium]